MPPIKILIVDDERTMLKALKSAFLSAGFDPVAVGSGSAAIAEISSQEAPFSAALIDLFMPDMAGRDLIQWVTKRSPETQIFAMSALMDANTEAQLKSAGVIAVLGKPFEDIFEAPKIVRRALPCAKDRGEKGQN